MDWILLVSIIAFLYLLVSWFLSNPTVGNYYERHVFITGCDTGFGHQLALRLDEMGFRVFAACLTRTGRDELARKSSSRLHTVALDVTNEESIKTARDLISEHLPPGKGLWGLVNNAGVAGSIGPAEWMTKDDYLRTLDVNLFGVTEVTRLFLSLLRQGRGRIVNMSSANGSVTVPYFVPYTISKYGVEVFSDSIRPEVRKYGVSVHIIKPGMFDTNIRQSAPIVDGLKSSFEKLDPCVQRFFGSEFLSELFHKVGTSPRASSNTASVINAYVHALTASHPRYRYRAGVDSYTLWRLLGWMPDWLSTGLYAWFLPTPRGITPES